MHEITQIGMLPSHFQFKTLWTSSGGQQAKTGIYCFINKGMLASAGQAFTFDPEKKD